MKITKEMKQMTQDLMNFLDASPTASYAVVNVIDELKKNGFRELREDQKWKLESGDKFYVKRGETAIVAGIAGKDVCESGFRVIGAHTDSPGFRVKNNSVFEKVGCVQLGVEVYGGPLLASWTDRDLTLAGRIVIDNNGKSESVLWKCDKVIARIPQLPIHMNREVNEKGLVLNPQKHVYPILAMAGEKKFTEDNLKNIIAEDLKIAIDSIKGFELELVDTQKASFYGINDEFFVSGRIDNLMMCHAGIKALTSMEDVPGKTSLIILFDNEEIGSSTMNGGASPLLDNIIERVVITTNADRESLLIAKAKSMVLSADGAHAVHPNYIDNWDEHYQNKLNDGPVIKINAKQRYASSVETTSFFEDLCKKAEIPVQKYIHRNDKPCGSTIGPITATRTGILTMDIGHPMFSMHSIREMAGTADQTYMVKVMKEFLNS